MKKETTLRIVKDIYEFQKSNFNNIKIYFDKNNFTEIYALIFGPKNTPYFGGNFFFQINFPENYPMNPPKVKFLTTNSDIRIHPNLYANGKVCLSIINTWPGPKWTPVMTLSSVLLSIESLLTEIPIVHEPGYAQLDPNNIKSIQYNIYVTYHTINLAILEVLNNNTNKNKKYFSELFNYFKNEINEYFNKNKNELKCNILTFKELYGVYPYEFKAYYHVKTNSLDFNNLEKKFNEITDKINLNVNKN